MKNVKINTAKIIQLMLDSKDFTESGVETAIKELISYKHLTFVNSKTDAEKLFKEWFANSDEGAEEYMNGFGGVHSNCIETFTLEAADPDEYTHLFKVSIYEYFVDGGSVDYMYSVSASQI